MHELSLGTWFIHITTLFEWMASIVVIVLYGGYKNKPGLTWLAIAMLPNLTSAMAAITWHIYDNSEALRGLVVFQAILTTLGNCCLAAAAWNLLRLEKKEGATT